MLRGDFRSDSDVDGLVSFAPESGWGLFDFMEMEKELGAMFKRKVDLVERQGLRNPFGVSYFQELPCCKANITGCFYRICSFVESGLFPWVTYFYGISC